MRASLKIKKKEYESKMKAKHHSVGHKKHHHVNDVVETTSVTSEEPSELEAVPPTKSFNYSNSDVNHPKVHLLNAASKSGEPRSSRRSQFS